MPALQWHKSSFSSGDAANCVELAADSVGTPPPPRERRPGGRHIHDPRRAPRVSAGREGGGVRPPRGLIVTSVTSDRPKPPSARVGVALDAAHSRGHFFM
ncbi:DUF397 domain-containing protein [Streptomyces sp. NPDC003442]